MLFKTAAELKEYFDVSGTITFEKIKATIQFVEDTILIPIMGRELYENLLEYYNNSTSDIYTDEDKYPELLIACRKVIGPYAAYNFIPKAELVISDSGAQRTETANTKSAYAYQIASAREQRLKEGEANSEALLKFLTEHTTSFNVWVESDEFKEYQSLFIKTGTDFNKLYKTPQPYRNYFAMRFKMVDVEMLTIQPTISPSLFEYLKEKDQQNDSEWTEAEAKLLFYIKKSIAYFTIAEAIPNLSVRVDTNGLTVVSENTVTANKDLEVRKDADMNKITALASNCYSSGQSWLKMAVTYISNNASEFSTWVAPVAATKVDLKNDTYTTVFGL